MTRIFLTSILSLLMGMSLIHAQSTDSSPDRNINDEIQSALEEVERSLDNIEIADIDLQGIMDQVKASLPTKEEMVKHQEVVRDALHDVVKEIKKIDFTELERALQDIGSLFNDLDIKNPEESNVRKI